MSNNKFSQPAKHVISKEETPVDTILNSVPEGKKEIVRQALLTISETSYSGPIPPPSSFAQYENILPGSADRILTLAEKQSHHRIEIEDAVIKNQIKVANRGQIFGFIAFIACLILAFLFAYLFDMKTFAATFLCVTTVTIVTLFITGKNHMRKENSIKSKDLK